MSKRSGLSQHAKRRYVKKPLTPGAIRREMAKLDKLPGDEIDLRGMPEKFDWGKAVIGKYYRPMKELISLRIDADVLHWFKAKGRGYQSRINKVLRNYFLKQVIG